MLRRSNADNGSRPWNSLRARLGTVAPTMQGVWPHQPRSIFPSCYNQPELRGFASDQNRAYLKQEVLRRFNGAISDVNLNEFLEEGAKYYLDKYIDATYGAPTDARRNETVQMLNERALRRIGQLYASQRAVTAQWLLFQHQPPHMNTPVMQVERVGMLNDYDREMTL